MKYKVRYKVFETTKAPATMDGDFCRERICPCGLVYVNASNSLAISRT